MNTVGLDRVLKNMDLLLSCGEAMVDFYQTCAETWPRERRFWSDLASDEIEHTTRLQLMQQQGEGFEKCRREASGSSPRRR